MAKLRDLVNRRKAVRNIRKITRTMELIATARFKKAMDRAAEAAAYTKKIAELAADLSTSAGEVSHPLLATRPTTKKALVLVLTANRGLCGGYNGSILREANLAVRQMTTAGTPFDLEASGKRGIAFFKFQRVPRAQEYTQFEDKPSFAQVDEVASRYIDLFISGQIDQVQVAYMKFQSASRQVAVVDAVHIPPADIQRIHAKCRGDFFDDAVCCIITHTIHRCSCPCCHWCHVLYCIIHLLSLTIIRSIS